MKTEEFAQRMSSLKPKLYKTALLYLKNESLAIETVDEAEYKAFISVKKLRQPEYFDTWVTRILINECKKMLRRKKRELSLDYYREETVISHDNLPLKIAIQTLSDDLKDVIILRFFTGFTLAETAKSLNIPVGTVSTRQKQALNLLKIELQVKEEN